MYIKMSYIQVTRIKKLKLEVYTNLSVFILRAKKNTLKFY